MEEKQERRDLLKVAICGKAPSSLGLAPYDDESFEIWTCSDLPLQVPRVTRHFELHDLEGVARRPGGEKYWEWLTTDRQGQPRIYVREPNHQIPDGAPYPLDEITGRFGDYFTNSISWMIALAIHEGARAIHVCGVDMAQDTEYSHQRPSCEHLLGWAAGAGIEVYVPPQADMLKTRFLYGFESDGGRMAEKFRTRRAELQERLQNKVAARDQMTVDAAFLQGALESQKYLAQWLS